MSIHIHVYKVVSKIEIDDLISKNEIIAKEKALCVAKNNPQLFGVSDCEFIAVSWEEK